MKDFEIVSLTQFLEPLRNVHRNFYFPEGNEQP